MKGAGKQLAKVSEDMTEIICGPALGLAIRVNRLARGWTQTELAEKCGLTYHTICQLESPTVERPTRIETLRLIASAFDCALMVRFGTYQDQVNVIANAPYPVASFTQECPSTPSTSAASGSGEVTV